MSDTRALQGKIAALRQRLDQVPGLTNLARASSPTGDGADALAEAATDGERKQNLLDAALRQIAAADGAAAIPQHLTARARHLLETGRNLIGQLRTLTDDPLLDAGALEGIGPDNDPLASGVRETTAMTESALRLVQAFPDAPSTQLRLSEGLDNILEVIADRITVLAAALDRRRVESERASALAGLLAELAADKHVDANALIAIGESVVTEARRGEPLRFPQSPAKAPALAVAWHALSTAHVLARLARHDLGLRRQPLPLVMAAVLHDVGMLVTAPNVLTQAGPLSDDDRRRVEAHSAVGAGLIRKHLPAAAELAEAAEGHHERFDGTGYPGGLRGDRLGLLTRLLAVADVYAALCSPRFHRPACDPRTALTDTLLAAESGGLDPFHAERLLHLSFYPVGSVVELADGATALVVGTHSGQHDLNAPSRPVVALLTDERGRCLPCPRHLDLAASEGWSIVRTLPPAQRRLLLGRRYPELVL